MEHVVFGKYSENLAPAQCFAWTSKPLRTQGDIQKIGGQNVKWDNSAVKMFSMNTMACLFV